MNRQKLLIYSKIPASLGIILFASIASFTLGVIAPKPTKAADCSDVYTPLSSFVVNGVNANKSAYVRAMNETGVPWELLASIHYRETNFSHTNPSNGQGIFQFVNGDGGPYPPGPVSDENFYKQLRFMANKLQTDYVYRGSVPREKRPLAPNEQNMILVKDTLFSYNGRATQYANQAAQFGYNATTQPYEGSPYVMNRFDCQRARMGIITKDYGTGIDGIDTRYGAFTIFARLRGDNFWLMLSRAYSWDLVSQETFVDSARTVPFDSGKLAPHQTIYLRVKARNMGNQTWKNTGSGQVNLATTNPSNRQSSFCTTAWMGCARPTKLIESSVTPGAVGTFEFEAKAPAGYGAYREYFNLVAEGVSWFNDFGLSWQFGVIPPTPSWQMNEQAVYTDSAYTKPANVGLLSPNTTYYTRLKVRNNGNTIWRNDGANPVRLGTHNPQDRASSFCTAGWLNCNRPALLKEASVSPGDIGTFEFPIKTPAATGTSKEYFRPVVEGTAWMNDIGMHLPFTVAPPTPAWRLESQKLYTSSAKTVAQDSSISNNSRVYVVLKARNIGNTTWTNTGSHPVLLGTDTPQDRTSIFKDNSWPTHNRAALLQESSVAPGEIGTFEFWLHVPYRTNGTAIKEYFRPVVEGTAWMNDIGMHLPFTFSSPDTAWEYMGQEAMNDGRSQSADLMNASRGTSYYLRLRLKNSSGLVWQQSNFRLGTSNPNDRTSIFYDNSWVNTNRAAQLKETSVAPGDTGTFEFSVKTPTSPTTANEYFRPVIEGKTWLTDIGLYWGFKVN